jgi:ligand-binding sensor domain-containing protein
MRNILLLLILFCTIIAAQQPGTVVNYTSMKNVNNIYLKDNKIYAATEGGIFTYNITDSTFFKLNKGNGLGSQSNTAVAVDNQNKIWIGSSLGIIDVYNPTTGSITKILDIYNSDKTKKQINDITVKGDTVFVSTDFGLSLINSKTLSFIETIIKFGSFSGDIKVTNITIDGLIYVNTQSGLAIQKPNVTNLSSPESWNTYTLPSSFGVTSINKIAKYGNLLLIATNKGIFNFENNTFVLYALAGYNLVDVLPVETGLYALGPYDLIYTGSLGYSVNYHSTQPVLKKLYKIGEDKFYIPSTAGVLYINGNYNNFIFPAGPSTNSFQYLGVENNGKVWAATGKDGFGIGIMKYDNEWFLYSSTNNSQIELNDFYKVSISDDNVAYGLSWGKGFTAFSENQIKTFNTKNTSLVGIPKADSFLVIADVKKDYNNNTWVLNYWSANKKPLSVLTKDSVWYHYDFIPLSLTSESTFGSMVIDRNNTKWITITASQQGLYYFNDNGTLTTTSDDKWGSIKETDGLNSNSISSILLDNRGELWVGTILGVNIIRDVSNPKSSISNSFPLRQQSIICMAVDPLNRKWVGTKQGVFLVSSDGATLLQQFDSKNSPLPTDDIKSIAFDNKNGIAYIGTDYGLTAFYTTALQPVDSFGDLFVYPNPFEVNPGSEIQLTIDGLIKDSQIKIYTIAGRLVKEFSSPGGKIASWDGRDNDGNIVPSGIYIIAAFDNEANSVAIQKFAVLKK